MTEHAQLLNLGRNCALSMLSDGLRFFLQFARLSKTTVHRCVLGVAWQLGGGGGGGGEGFWNHAFISTAMGYSLNGSEFLHGPPMLTVKPQGIHAGSRIPQQGGSLYPGMKTTVGHWPQT